MLMIQIEELEGLMRDHVPSWLGFCHNDLQYGNMLLHVSSPQVGYAVQAPAFRAELAWLGLELRRVEILYQGGLDVVSNAAPPLAGSGLRVCLHTQAGTPYMHQSHQAILATQHGSRVLQVCIVEEVVACQDTLP